MLDRPACLLIRGASILTPDSERTVLESADVLVEDGVISAVGKVDKSSIDRCDRIIEATGKLLVPGLINAHTHSPANLIQGTGDRLSHPAFMWMNQAYTANKTPHEIYVSAMLGCIQMLLSGTTAAIDHFPGQAFGAADVDAVMSAYRDSGMRAVLGLRFYDAGFDDIAPRDGAIPPDLAQEMKSLNPLRPMPLEDVRGLTEEAVERWHGTDGHAFRAMGRRIRMSLRCRVRLRRRRE